MRRLLALAFLITTALPLRAQEPAPAHTITVRTTSTVEREPDEAVLRVAVETTAPTAREAAEENAERVDAVLDALRRMGLAEDRYRTVSYEVRPEYVWHRDGGDRERRLAGYRALNMLEVTVTDLDRVGTVIDGAMAAGANRITGLAFQLGDPAAARRAALEQAVQQARREARALAGAAGRTLGPVVSITTNGVRVAPQMRAVPEAARVAGAGPAPTPIEPGPLTTTATVTVVYALERP